ncbi:restriction endonuclease subunit S [Serratia sp. 14-2641]|uniref:restriction endonuclease subunit S n=1 Tax=Serratia sp. 14-2641 TaxID=1841657 RepID=UPI00080FFE30|nr:restriction endonuclease subunit S [Serratia sp. 14-2641]OCJ45423.1 type I restriction endonuclease subunit S [Serratia sp. 14-2641]
MSAGKLPEGWVNTTIGVICEVKGGKRLPKGKALLNSKTEYPYIRVTDFENGSVNLSNIKYLDSETFSAISNYTISKNDLYISIAGTIGLVGEIPSQLDNANLTENAAKLSSILGTDKKYLKFVLSSNKTIEQFNDKTTSSGQPKLALFRIRDCDFPCAPINEQKIIAEKLDTLLAQVGSTKARLEKIPQILKRFRQAVLAAAVSGKLTRSFRNSHSLIDWHNTNLGALIVDSCNGLAKRQGLDGNEITILRLADFKDAQRIKGNERKIKLDSKEESKYSLDDNDILVIRVNGSADLAGRFIEYKSIGDIEGFCDHFIRLRLDSNKIISRFLTYIANEGEGRFYLRNSLSTSAGQNTINQTSIKGLSFLLPPLPEQAEIVRRVEQLFAYADTIEKQVNNALARVNNLTQSILAKAFRGELTAQWRAENPDLISGENSATALLEKIKAERAASGSKKNARKKA